MTKGIKYFLITSVALGFLQMDTSAMRMKRDDEDSNNNNLVTKLKSEGSNPIENKKAECPEENDQNNKIASILLENMRDLIQENGKIRELQQTTLSRMQQQSEEINALQAKINPLLQENETLNRKVGELQRRENEQDRHHDQYREIRGFHYGWHQSEEALRRHAQEHGLELESDSTKVPVIPKVIYSIVFPQNNMRTVLVPFDLILVAGSVKFSLWDSNRTQKLSEKSFSKQGSNTGFIEATSLEGSPLKLVIDSDILFGLDLLSLKTIFTHRVRP